MRVIGTGFFVMFLGVAPGLAVLADMSVVPDGTTATTAAISPDGGVHVQIAPAAGGTSLNRYTRFNVEAGGVALDNRGVNARTIVNEVTGALPSTIAGPLEVVGDRADVVLANPNGIVVSGGHFINTRNLVLGTGTVTGHPGGPAELAVTGGDIAIGPGGLSGVLERVDLIAHRLRVAGRIETGDTSTLVATLGNSQTVLAPGEMPQPDFNAHNVTLDITDSAFLAAGTIRVQASGDGPGVRVAGAMMAARDIEICADGMVDFAGHCEGGALALADARLSAGRHVTLGAEQVALTGGRLVADRGNVSIDAGQGGVRLAGTRLAGASRDTAGFLSQGAVSITSSGALELAAGPGGARTELRSTDFGGGDDIVLTAGRGLTLSQSDIVSSADIRFSSPGGIALEDVNAMAGKGMRALATQDIALNGSQIDAQAGIVLDGAGISLAGTDQHRARLQSGRAGVTLLARAGDVVNRGGLIQGETRSPGDSTSHGAVTIDATGNIDNASVSPQALGVIFGNDDLVSLTAGGDIANRTGRILGNRDVMLQAGGQIRNVTQTTGSGNGITFETHKGRRRWYTLFLRRDRITEYRADFGQRLIPGEQAIIAAAGGMLRLDAGSIANSGGDLAGVDLALRSAGDISLDAGRSGSLHYIQRCNLFCRSIGSGQVLSFGGNVTATRTARLDAGGTLHMTGGRVSGGGDVSIHAETLDSRGQKLPVLVERPGGFGNFFQGSVFWLAEQPGRALFSSLGGELRFDIAGASTFSQSDLAAAGGVSLPPDAQIVAKPDPGRAIGRAGNGLFRFLRHIE